MNNCLFIGNLTKDPTLAETQSGTKVATFTLAVQRDYTNADGDRVADFIDFVAWRNLGKNLAKYCKKGDKVAVTGKLQTRTYEAQDGSKRKISEIIANDIEYLSTKREARAEAEQPTNAGALQQVPSDDDLPF